MKRTEPGRFWFYWGEGFSTCFCFDHVANFSDVMQKFLKILFSTGTRLGVPLNRSPSSGCRDELFHAVEKTVLNVRSLQNAKGDRSIFLSFCAQNQELVSTTSWYRYCKKLSVYWKIGKAVSKKESISSLSLLSDWSFDQFVKIHKKTSLELYCHPGSHPVPGNMS